MSEYHSKHTSSHISSVPFQGAAPATPCKLHTIKPPSVFSNFTKGRKFESRLNEMFGCADLPLAEGTVDEELERYLNGLPSSRDTDIIHFWEVSFLTSSE